MILKYLFLYSRFTILKFRTYSIVPRLNRPRNAAPSSASKGYCTKGNASVMVSGLQQKPISTEQAYIRQSGMTLLEDRTLGSLLESAAYQWPKRENVISIHQGVRLSFSELLLRADRLAAGLRKIGLRPGDRIGIWSPNYYEWLIVYGAAVRAGLIIATINPYYRADELHYCLRKIGMRAVFAPESYKDQKYAEMLLVAKTSCPVLEHIIIFDEEHVTGTRRFRDVEALANKKEIETIKEEQAVISPCSATNIQFTSGTTGKPKAVVLSHRSMVNNSKQVALRCDIGGRKICLNVPFFHAFGMIGGILASWHVGGTIVLENPTFSPTQSIKAIMREKCFAIYGTPTMWVNIIDVQIRTGAKVESLHTGLIGGSPISPHLFKRIREYLGFDKIMTIYGLTEATACVTQSLPNESPMLTDTTVGCVSDHLEVKVIDENGNIVPFGTPGELCVRGYSTMIEYWEDEKNTSKVLSEDKWLKTGDKFILHKNKYGSVVGRLKDMLIRGGENIFPREIEIFYETHPAIVEVYVIGVYDEIYGEEICAFIRLRDGAKLTTADVVNYAKGELAAFKIPRYIQFRDDFPKTASGKIQKYKLREEVEEQNFVPKKPKD